MKEWMDGPERMDSERMIDSCVTYLDDGWVTLGRNFSN